MAVPTMPKVTRKLTETEIRNAKPQNSAHKLYDEGGLMLLVRPTGTKVWQYPYKFSGKYNVATIGQYGGTPDKVGTANARKLRDEIKALLKQGIDPNKNKRDIHPYRRGSHQPDKERCRLPCV